ncbi:MAG: response regulator, partial [Flavobacteriales bacterium]|nr:response regulator [Flavobacteriales bacterium]
FLNEWPQGSVVLAAANGLEYEQRCREAGPIDLVIVDLHMPVRDGWETLRWIAQHQPDTKAIALSFDQTPQ